VKDLRSLIFYIVLAALPSLLMLPAILSEKPVAMADEAGYKAYWDWHDSGCQGQKYPIQTLFKCGRRFNGKAFDKCMSQN